PPLRPYCAHSHGIRTSGNPAYTGNGETDGCHGGPAGWRRPPLFQRRIARRRSHHIGGLARTVGGTFHSRHRERTASAGGAGIDPSEIAARRGNTDPHDRDDVLEGRVDSF